MRTLGSSCGGAIERMTRHYRVVGIHSRLATSTFRVGSYSVDTYPAVICLSSFQRRREPSLRASVGTGFVCCRPRVRGSSGVGRVKGIVEHGSSDTIFRDGCRCSCQNLRSMVRGFCLGGGLIVAAVLRKTVATCKLNVPCITVNGASGVYTFRTQFNGKLVVRATRRLRTVLSPSVFFGVRLGPTSVRPICRFKGQTERHVRRVYFS